MHHNPRALILAGTIALLSAPIGHAQVSDSELDEALRNPVIGNFKGYAEFKMGRYRNARLIWEALAARGDAEAHFNLGILYEDGLGVDRAIDTAVVHYLAAATAGHRNAQYRVGLLYSAGGKVARDEVLARRWLGAAADQGDDEARALIATLDAAAQNARDRDFLEAERLRASGSYHDAAVIWRRLSDAGDTRSRTRLAWLYEAGQGVERDLDEAARLFRRSAEEGDADAQYALAVMLETGRGQARDPVAAREWFERAAAQGHASARAALEAR